MSTAPIQEVGPDAQGHHAEECCTVCAHDVAKHDSISLRFCEATQGLALSRSCICPKTT